MLPHGRQSTTSQCRDFGRGHGGRGRGAAWPVAALGGAAGAIAELRGICSRRLVSRGGFAMNGVGEVGGWPRSGRACGHSWSMCWTARKTWRIGRTRGLRMKRWNNPRMPMRMLSKAVGKRHSRRFVFAAAGAACRTTTYLFYFGARQVWSHGGCAVGRRQQHSMEGCAEFLVMVGAHLRGPVPDS
jgi:hypothetical protein